MVPIAIDADVTALVSLRAAVVDKLTRDYGPGPFDATCRVRDVGRVTHRRTPLIDFEWAW